MQRSFIRIREISFFFLITSVYLNKLHIPASTNRITEDRIILNFSQSGSSRASSDVSIRNADGGLPFSGNQASSKSVNLLGSVHVHTDITGKVIIHRVREKKFSNK